MFTRILVVLAAAVAVLGLSSVPAYAGPPVGAPCSVGERATACFEHYGDHIWVKDTVRDGHTPVGSWFYVGDSGSGRCYNHYGAAGGWKDCNYDMREHEQIAIRAVAVDSDGNLVSGSAGPYVFANTSG